MQLKRKMVGYGLFFLLIFIQFHAPMSMGESFLREDVFAPCVLEKLNNLLPSDTIEIIVQFENDVEEGDRNLLDSLGL